MTNKVSEVEIIPLIHSVDRTTTDYVHRHIEKLPKGVIACVEATDFEGSAIERHLRDIREGYSFETMESPVSMQMLTQFAELKRRGARIVPLESNVGRKKIRKFYAEYERDENRLAAMNEVSIELERQALQMDEKRETEMAERIAREARNSKGKKVYVFVGADHAEAIRELLGQKGLTDVVINTSLYAQKKENMDLLLQSEREGREATIEGQKLKLVFARNRKNAIERSVFKSVSLEQIQKKLEDEQFERGELRIRQQQEKARFRAKKFRRPKAA